ncbi:MAG: N-acetylmuramoyl-L-alanine amidase [Defluviicoccus sp.]|nr:MAG: N-acetylmuramoyl-L-alanine amidase [Defluviicoccus sp.]
MAKRLAILLRRDQGVRVVLTRDDDKTVSLAHRVEISNAAAADLFISIHANSLGDARANAVETYYFGAPADGDTWRLAQQENAESGMPIGAFRELVATLGDTLKRQESVTLAHFVQTQLLAVVMRRTGPLGAGVKVAPFVVLMGLRLRACWRR